MLKLRMLDRNLPNLAVITSSPPTSASALDTEIENNDNVDASASGDYDLTTHIDETQTPVDAESLENTADKSQKQEKILEKTMIWTELEACKRQVNQVGVSACGATALVNVLQVKTVFLISFFRKKEDQIAFGS